VTGRTPALQSEGEGAEARSFAVYTKCDGSLYQLAYLSGIDLAPGSR
jgi:hypothetical protein